MIGPMGRRRQSNLDLPARMYFRRGRYYWGRDNVALGADKRVALHRYAELETGDATPGTFADAANLYRAQELPRKATKTREEYARQLNSLCVAFGHVPIDGITPAHVRQYMRTRGKPIAATREKALLICSIQLRARRGSNECRKSVRRHPRHEGASGKVRDARGTDRST